MYFGGEKMKKQALYAQLLRQHNQYQALHLRTAETDLTITKQLTQGKSVTRVAMDVPCSEATVYRAIQRVRSFLAK